MRPDHLEFLVEEPSMETTLHHIVPRIVPNLSFAVRLFNGKPALLRALPDRLRGYRNWSRAGGLGIAVLVDRDSDDCRELLDHLDDCVRAEGLSLCSVTARRAGLVLNRLVVEELEAWFFGDVAAVATAFPGVPLTLASRRSYRDPDAVRGGTAEAFARVLREAGHHKAGLGKIAAAAAIAPHLDVEHNSSSSFGRFRDGLRLLAAGSS